MALHVAPRAKLSPFYYKTSYQALDLSWYAGLGLRAGLLICALAMCLAVLALVPRRETWFTELGTRTLYCCTAWSCSSPRTRDGARTPPDLALPTAVEVARGYQPTSSQPMWPSGSTCRVACATP
ncbi:hypothetical protein [Nonomuraea sp. NPDC005692]|uniref:hypothetical protein n=1 Tax=Nonomuraea sp. NPDC005692 TaxID=3157168 RepID=UPI0033E1C005